MHMGRDNPIREQSLLKKKKDLGESQVKYELYGLWCAKTSAELP